MVFITLVCSYLSSTLLKINAEQIIKLSSQNLRKSFALIAAEEASRPSPESLLLLSGLVWWVGREDFLEGAEAPRGPTMGWVGQTQGWDVGWGRLCRGLKDCALPGLGPGVFVSGCAGPPLPHVHADIYTCTHTDRHKCV